MTVASPALMEPETGIDSEALSVSPEFAVAVTLMISEEASDPAIQAITTAPSGAGAPSKVAFPTNTLGGTLEVAATLAALLGNT